MPTHAQHLPSSLILVGAGKMGGSMLEGWLAVGMPPQGVTVIDPRPSEAMTRLCNEHGIALNPTNPPAAPEVLVLGIKPQGLEEAAPQVNALLGPQTVVVSILAGKTIDNLRSRMPAATAIVRTIPNLPASIGRGATGAASSPEVTEAQRLMTDALLRSNGVVEWVASEDLIDAVTGLSGSGPAYVFHLVECLAEAGAAAGAGELLHQSELPPETLRQNVTSPGGTTAAALQVLMAEPNSLKALMREAVAAAKHRAEELSG
jgi:pyrroline-5-carboxylate reductase